MKKINTLQSAACVALALLGSFGARAQQAKGTWAADVIVSPGTAGSAYKDARVSVASDGAIYVGRLEKIAPSNVYNTFRVLKSVDTGRTWSTFTSGSLGVNVKCVAMDLVAVGTGSTYKVLVARSYVDTTVATAVNSLYMNAYDLTGNSTATLVNESYNYNSSGRGFMSVSVATDSRDKNSGAAPYSYSLVAGKAGPYDSVLIFTTNGTTSTMARRGIYGTPNFIRRISASIGSTAAAVSLYGRLGVAWDEFPNSASVFGGLKCQFVYADDGTAPAFGGPFRIGTDSVSYRNPSLCLSQNTATGQTTIRAVVAYELTGGTYTGIRYRVDSVVGLTAAPAFSTALDLANLPTLNTKQPHIAYDPVYDNYLMTYYDSSTGAIPYKVVSAATVFTATPVTVKANYRDATGPSAGTMVWPRVDINTAAVMGAFVWNDNGATMFDAEYRTAGLSVASHPVLLADISLYPNPARDRITIKFSSTENASGMLMVTDLTGRTVLTQPITVANGINEIPVQLNSLPAGNYLVQMAGERLSAHIRFAVVQ